MDSWKRGIVLPGDKPSYSPNLHSALSMKREDYLDFLDPGTPMGSNGLESRSAYDLSGTRAKMNELQLPNDQSFVSSFSGMTISDGYFPYDENAESFLGKFNSFQLQNGNGFYHGTDENLPMSGMMEDFDSLKFDHLAPQRPYTGVYGERQGFEVSNLGIKVTDLPFHPDVFADFGLIPDEQTHSLVHQQSKLSRRRILRCASEHLIPARNMQDSKFHVNYLYSDVQKPLCNQRVTLVGSLDEKKQRICSCRNERAYPDGIHSTSGLRFDSFSSSDATDTNIPSLRIDKSSSGDQHKYFSRLNNTGKSVCLLAKDQDGCRYLQQNILEGRRKDIEKILLAVTDHMVELTMNPFGNYLVQKLFDACDEDQRTRILRVITRRKVDLLRISCDMHGTRVVQKIIEALRTPEHFSIMVSSLKPNILTLMKNANGNHVAQHCLCYLPSEYKELLFETVATNCIELATDRHGCCMLQKCIAHSSGEQRFLLTYAIAFNSRILSQDEFGNYAVQYILDKNEPRATEDILDHLKGHFVDLSMQKYSSNVVELCLKSAGKERHISIIQELIGSPRLNQVMQDPYGNYVIQSAIMTSKGTLRSTIMKAIKPYIPSLLANPYGKKVLSSKCLKNVKWHLV